MLTATPSPAPAAPVYSVPAALSDVPDAERQAWRDLTAYVRALRDGVPPLTRILSDLLATPEAETVSDLNVLVNEVTGRLGASLRTMVLSLLPALGSGIELQASLDDRRLHAVNDVSPATKGALHLLLAPETDLSDQFSILEAIARFVTLWRFTEASARAAWVDPTDSNVLWTSVQRMARRVEHGDCRLRLNPDGTNTLVLRCPDGQVLAAWTMPKPIR